MFPRVPGLVNCFIIVLLIFAGLYILEKAGLRFRRDVIQAEVKAKWRVRLLNARIFANERHLLHNQRKWICHANCK
jgi:hypothetical protein